MERILSNKTVLVTYPTTGRKEPPKFIHGIQKSGYKMGIGFAKCQEQRYYPKGLRGRHFPKLSAFINDPSYKDGAATYPEICKRDVISACNNQNSGPASESNQMKKLLTPVFKKVDAFCRFSRPHTVIGTIVGIISVSLLPLDSMHDLSLTFFIGLLKALLPAVFMNIYVVGLNQVFDVDIDKVNKPTLPLASGEISREVGTLIVICFFIMSFYMGFMFQSPPVIFFLLGFCFLGTAYSIDLPLLRWKQNAFLAASCIICVRGILIQLAFYVHMQSYVLGRQLVLKKSVVFATAFMWFFAAVIALFKDIPDVDGDRHFGIQSFTVRLGQERVFWLCIRLLLIAYGIAMLVGASSSNMCLSFVTVLGHAMLASLLWIRAQSVDTQNRALMSSFYMFIWKLLTSLFSLPEGRECSQIRPSWTSPRLNMILSNRWKRIAKIYRWDPHWLQIKNDLYKMPRTKVLVHLHGEEDKLLCYPKWLSGSHFPKFPAFINDLSYKEGSATFQRAYKIYGISACNNHNCGPPSESIHSKKLLASVFRTVDAFCRFSRPHTILGTIVGIISVSLLPLKSMSDLSPIFFMGLLKALLPALCMNIYVVGLNQVFDVEIDKVNKPTLPLASGEFSREAGIFIVICFCIVSFYLGFKSQSPPVLFALLISCLLGTAYSIDLPLLRWKQHAFLAASCILCVRAILVQLAFFIHMQSYVLGRQVVLKKSLVFATAFMCFFSAVIALFKDIPDVDGDRHFGIQSFSVQLGQERVFWLCIRLLLIAYGIAMLVGASSSNMYQSLVTVLGHAMLASLLWVNAQSVDTQNRASITSFYMFIWKLFYAEYLLIPFVH